MRKAVDKLKEIYGKEIADPGTKALGSKYAIKHPRDGGGKIEFIDFVLFLFS